MLQRWRLILAPLHQRRYQSSTTHASPDLSLHKVMNPLPATFMRGGTSKGIFIEKRHLPNERDSRARIFQGIMGSPDPYARQLNGMGGGVSSLSKICVVGPASPEQKAQGIDVEYTFAQVGIESGDIDYSGNCGNLSAMVGVFAVDRGMVPRMARKTQELAEDPRIFEERRIRSFNTNTGKIIDTTFRLGSEGHPDLDAPEIALAGVPDKASPIVLEFINPAGAATGKLLPTGNPVDELKISDPFNKGGEVKIKASLVDATNPTVFVSSTELASFLPVDAYLKGEAGAVSQVSPILELIRTEGALAMNLDPSNHAQPKIALLQLPDFSVKDDSASELADIRIHALSMGVLHKAVPMTVGLCLAVAAKIEGTLAWELVKQADAEYDRLYGDGFVPSAKRRLNMRHSGGLVSVGATFSDDGQVTSVDVLRTGRRLMEGSVYW